MNLNHTNQKSAKNGFVLFLAFFAVVFTFLLWRVKFGVADIDEAYYVAVPWRIFRGASMMEEEWGIIQLSGFLMYPLIWLYEMLFTSTDGILLAFRYVYTVFSGLVSLYTYACLRKTSSLGAALAALSLLLYAPFGIAALSYNSMAIHLMAVFCVTLAGKEKWTLASGCGLGVVFAAAVLCCPYLLIALIAYTVFFAVRYLIVMHRQNGPDMQIRQGLHCRFVILAGIYLGGAVLAAVFGAFVLSRSSLHSIVHSIPYIANDGYHSGTLLYKLKLYITSLMEYYRPCLPLLVMKIVLAIVGTLTKKESTKRVCFVGMVLLTIPSLGLAWRKSSHINFVMMPINTLALLCLPMAGNNKQIWRIFKTIYVPGWIYSVCLHFSSNQDAFAIASAMTVSVIGSMMIIVLCSQQLVCTGSKQTGRLLWVSVMAVLVVSIGFEAEMRYTNVFRDTDISTQICYVEAGPEKGLYVSETIYEEYESIYGRVSKILEQFGERKMLYVADSYQTILYLIGDVQVSGPSAWNVFNSERMQAYYEINPQNIPDIICVSRDSDIGFLWFLMDDFQVALDNGFETVYIRNGEK